MDLDEPTDEDLVAAARAGDDRAFEVLLLRHRGVVHAATTSRFVVGADRDDVVQEGLIGLLKAVRDFDPGLGVGFRPFADLCVRRQVGTAVKAANRHKHGPLADYVPLHRPLLLDDGECTLGDLLPASPLTDPSEQVLLLERVRDLGRHVRERLSDLEREVLRLHVDGWGYRDIATVLSRQAKSVDNTLQRAKRKIAAHAAEWDAMVA